MSKFTVCARFRPLSSKERRENGDSVCVRCIDSENFVLKIEEEHLSFSFDRVFCEKSQQSEVYEFLALPIVRDAVNGINGTIITYGQTGAGKTYSMEGPSVLESDEQNKGILPRIVEELFACIGSSSDSVYTIKLSMVEIYMEKVRDLFDLSKDNIQIKETKPHGILLSGVTVVSLSDPSQAFQSLSTGIANRAVGETRILLLRSFVGLLSSEPLTEMNMASSRSHCVYIFTVQKEATTNIRVKTGKLVLLDLAGSEKVEKTGAEGRVLEEAKTINKSLSALGNVIHALTSGSPGKASHVPYRDSKLTRILQDALGGNSHAALLCCCSPSPSNAPETLSTLRFGARAKHIKASPCSNSNEKKSIDLSPNRDESCERILNKLSERLDSEDVKLLEELFILEGIFFNPTSIEDIELAYDDVTSQTISTLQQAIEDLRLTVGQLQSENKALKTRVGAAENSNAQSEVTTLSIGFLQKITQMLRFFLPWIRG